MTDKQKVMMTSVDLPSLDWLNLLLLLSSQMNHMTAEEMAFCVKIAGQIRYQTTDQAFDKIELQKENT